ncbi:DNA polymerase III subunit delta [Bacillaceae bacterium SIJ1]|uniref:DNA polymerase III subunit delta n=1 Tax=Litoribacterium kuwaitense TaxID=1398745 RepID=UPI0013EBF95C|nr:DNA polymerase III subunit delta [Litoribacterium kuwaitense]NGP43493.1 DNA polymerase III subunit delta [Litoribacterium kuwaitense]
MAKANANINVLFGEESFLLDEYEDAILQATIGNDPSPFDLSVFDLEETPIQTALEDAETLPLMNEQKVILLKHPFFLTSLKPKGAPDHDLDALTQYINNPSPYTVLIFRAGYAKLDERKKLVKQLKKLGTIKEASPLREDELYQWIEQTAKKEGSLIDPGARNALLNRIGPSLRMLREEIRKLSLYGGEQISLEMVENLVPRTLDQNLFALMDDLLQKNATGAIQRYHDLLRQKEEPIKLLLLLASQARAMLQVNELLRKGYGQSQVAKRLKMHPYRVKVISGQLKKAQADFPSMLSDMGRLDVQMKTGKIDKVLGLELFLLKYTGAA